MSTLRKFRGVIRSFFPKRMKDFADWQEPFRGLKGLEVGGPSHAFTNAGFLPLYSVIDSLDGCNFSSNTVWEGNISEGNTFRYGNKTGRQYIADATSLPQINDNSYDFLLSCHSLEHLANPIRALLEWKRVLKAGGLMLIVLPHKDGTFDHDRPVTKIEHMIEDYKMNKGEDDDTHFAEVIAKHDLSRDRGVKDLASLVERTKNNFTNRCVHHHTFHTPVLLKLLDYAQFQIIKVGHFLPFHIIALAEKRENGYVDNRKMLSRDNPVFANSPFLSDKN